MENQRLINTVKEIMGTEFGATNEMARKAYNNTLTEKGKTDITEAVKKMIEEDKTKGSEHHKTFVFKALHELAKQKVGEPILTTKLQEVSGCKYPQPINKLLSSLVESGYLTRETSHVEPEKGEPKPKGRPKGPEVQKAEKPTKFGGLDLKKKGAEKSETEPPASVSENYQEEDENEMCEDNIDEASIESIKKSLISKFGVDGNKKGETVDEGENNGHIEGTLNKKAIDKADDEYYEKSDGKHVKGKKSYKKEELNESFLKMKYLSGIITDSQYATARKKLIK